MIHREKKTGITVAIPGWWVGLPGKLGNALNFSILRWCILRFKIEDRNLGPRHHWKYTPKKTRYRGLQHHWGSEKTLIFLQNKMWMNGSHVCFAGTIPLLPVRFAECVTTLKNEQRKSTQVNTIPILEGCFQVQLLVALPVYASVIWCYIGSFHKWRYSKMVGL